jgi:hypothetical protein
MVHFLVFLFVAAYFVREVWNRLISDVFSVRALDTQEAITIILLLGIFFSYISRGGIKDVSAESFFEKH